MNIKFHNIIILNKELDFKLCKIIQNKSKINKYKYFKGINIK